MSKVTNNTILTFSQGLFVVSVTLITFKPIEQIVDVEIDQAIIHRVIILFLVSGTQHVSGECCLLFNMALNVNCIHLP